jgi:hypothetical protein
MAKGPVTHPNPFVNGLGPKQFQAYRRLVRLLQRPDVKILHRFHCGREILATLPDKKYSSKRMENLRSALAEEVDGTVPLEPQLYKLRDFAIQFADDQETVEEFNDLIGWDVMSTILTKVHDDDSDALRVKVIDAMRRAVDEGWSSRNAGQKLSEEGPYRSTTGQRSRTPLSTAPNTALKELMKALARWEAVRAAWLDGPNSAARRARLENHNPSQDFLNDLQLARDQLRAMGPAYEQFANALEDLHRELTRRQSVAATDCEAARPSTQRSSMGRRFPRRQRSSDMFDDGL